MAFSRRRFVIIELRSFNKNLVPQLRREKFRKMGASLYSFFRGTNHLFWADFVDDARLKKFSSPKTKTWLQGDAHIYNLGYFENAEGDLVYGLNDFDEAVIADYQFDFFRFATSIILVARENGTSKREAEQKLVDTFARSYLKQIDKICGKNNGDKIEFIVDKTSTPLKDYMEVIHLKNKKARTKMLDKWTIDEHFDPHCPMLGKVSKKERQALVDAIEGKSGKSQYKDTLKGPLKDADAEYFKILDVAARLCAGTGSLGTNRYYVLINGSKETPKMNVILDVKCQGEPSWLKFLKEEDQANNSNSNHAEWTVKAYRALSRRPDCYLGWIELPAFSKAAPAGFYSIRERSPEKDAYPALCTDLKHGTQKA